MALYREQALQARSDRLDGDILLTQSWSSWIIFWIVLITIAITVAYLLLAPYTKRTTAIGQLVPNNGAIFINSPSIGTIVSVHTMEGQRVSTGDVLFTLRDERYFSSVDGSGSPLDQRFAKRFHTALQTEENALLEEKAQIKRLMEQTQESLQRQMQSLDGEIAQMNVQIKHHEERLSLAKSRLEKNQELVQSGFFTQYALTEQEENIAALQAQAASHQREHKSLQSRKLELETEWLSNPSKTKISLSIIEGKLSILRQKMQERNIQSEVNIVAPIDGVITGITALVGQTTGNQPLAVLLAENAKLKAHVYLSSSEVGFVEPGQKVRLRYQAYPYQKFGQYIGTLIEVSQSPIARESLPSFLLSATSNIDFYRAAVELESQFATVYQQPKRLVSGMVLEADIEQDRRRLIEWIFEPLYGLKKYN